MSFQAMAWALVQKPKGSKERFILLMLANYASNETGDCFPSISTLVEATGLSRDSVMRGIKALEEDGFVSTKRRKADGVNLPNYYTLNLQGVVAPCDHGSSTMRLGVVAQSDHNLSSEPINEPKIAKADPLDEEFNSLILAEYPPSPHSLKSEARKAYKSLNRADRVKCIRGVARFSQRFGDKFPQPEDAKKEVQFVMGLHKWIKKSGWEIENVG